MNGLTQQTKLNQPDIMKGQISSPIKLESFDEGVFADKLKIISFEIELNDLEDCSFSNLDSY